MSHAKSAARVVRDIRRKTRRRFSAEEIIRIVLEGLRGEESIAARCRRKGLNPNLYYRWSQEFLEASKKRLLGDTTREGTSSEVGMSRSRSGWNNGNLGLIELASRGSERRDTRPAEAQIFMTRGQIVLT
jgi:transposase